MKKLRRIKVKELVQGMYFCGFDGPWIDNPFWRNKFLMRRSTDVEQAQSSGYEYCWIDPEQGFDVTDESDDEDGALSQLPVEDANLKEEINEAVRLYEIAKDSTKIMFKQARLGKALDVESCRDLVDEITASITKDSNALLSIIRLKRADEYTYMHSVAVCAMMVALGRTLGMDDVACKEAGLAGYLHDVGKAFIPLHILNKPDKLTDLEYKVIQRHPVLGYEYLKGFSGVPEYVLDVCLHHHEKMNGAGYPEKQQGQQIGIYSRMAAICDVYDAVTSARPYKEGWDPADSIAKMESWTGHFDRSIFLAFVKTLGIYPVGSIVKLASGRTAVVIRQNANDLTKPVVKAFTLTVAVEVLQSEVIDLSAPDQADLIIERSGQDWIKPGNVTNEAMRSLCGAEERD